VKSKTKYSEVAAMDSPEVRNFSLSELCVKSPKITFVELSKLVNDTTCNASARGHYTPSEAGSIMDALYRAPRLSVWQVVPDVVPTAYRLWTMDDLMYVYVTSETIQVVKGIRSFPVTKGLQAASLHASIQTAQSILGKNKAVPSSSDEEEDAEYFTSDPATNGSVIDSAFEQMDTPSDDPFGRKKPEDSLNLGTELDAQLDADEDIQKVAPEPTVPQSDPAPRPRAWDKRTVPESWFVGRLKSLQGRVLNIMEASFSDKTQRDAVKTLVNKEFRREMSKAGGEQ
jgi:hypothetical protein